MPVTVGDVDDMSMTCTELTNNLKLRSKDATTNNEVTALQNFLLDIGLLDSDPTGYFGAATLKAVKAFQRQNKLLDSGFVGEFTRKAIRAKSCGEGTEKQDPVSQDTSRLLVVFSNGSQIESLNASSKDAAYRACKEIINKNISATMELKSYKCVWGKDVIFSPGTEVIDTTPKRSIGVFTIYKNGEILSTSDSLSKEDAYAKCKAYQASYPGTAVKCVLNGEVIYTTSKEVLDVKNSPLKAFVIYKNGEVIAKADSMSKEDTYALCKKYQASYVGAVIKCVWNGEVLFTTSDEAFEPKPVLNTLVIYKKTEILLKAASMSKEDAYMKCKHYQESYPSTYLKCMWGDEIISSPYFKVVDPPGPEIFTSPAVFGASTMCTQLTRNLHRGDESADTKML
jgi:hypothetical protein